MAVSYELLYELFHYISFTTWIWSLLSWFSFVYYSIMRL